MKPKHASASALTISVPLDGLTVVAPRAVLVTDRSCERVLGLTVRAWRKVARAMLASGLPVTDTADGLTSLVSDVERYFVEHAPHAEPRTYKRDASEASDDDDTDISRDLGIESARRAGMRAA